MPRVTTVAKARKDAGHCQHCGQPILAGQSYRWFKRKTGPASGYTIKRHSDCPTWKPSELTANTYQATYLAAVEAFDDGDLTCAEDIANAMRDVAEAARSNAEQLREGAESIESGFGHPTSQSDEMTERADGWESFADEIEQEADQIEGEEFEADSYTPCEECGLAQADHPDEETAGHEYQPEEGEEWLDELRSRAEEAIGNSPE